MNVFELVKDRITVPEAASYYGLEPSHNGMARCPFHPDRHPSIKASCTPGFYASEMVLSLLFTIRATASSGGSWC